MNQFTKHGDYAVRHTVANQMKSPAGVYPTTTPKPAPVHYLTITLSTENTIMSMVDIFHDTMVDYDSDFAIWEALTSYVYSKHITGLTQWEFTNFHDIAVQLADGFMGKVSSLDQFKLGMVTFDEEVSACMSGLKNYLDINRLTVSRMYPTMLEGAGTTLTLIVEAVRNEHYVPPSLQQELYL